MMPSNAHDLSTPLAWALAYAQIGWYVLPLEPKEKQPLGRLVPRGMLDATLDFQIIRSWWMRHPDAGVGIALAQSGLVAIDVDPRNGGTDTFDQLQAQHGSLRSDVMAFTGGGGEHHVFLVPHGHQVSLPGTLGPGVDVKANGYIVAEPSIHPSGKQYGWEHSSNPLDGVVPSILPDWLRNLRVQRQDAPRNGSGMVVTGGRNEHLSRRGFLLRKAGMRVEHIADVLLRLNADECSPPLPDDEVRTIAQRKVIVQPDPVVFVGGTAQQQASEQDAPPYAVVPFSDLAHFDPVPPAYVWDGYIPVGCVTLLGAHGGAGKSTIALMLAVTTCMGLPLFGVATKQANVLFFSGEDPGETVRFRLKRICVVLGVRVADLANRLHILDATGGNPVMYQEVPGAARGPGMLTATYSAVSEYTRQHRIGLVIIDNASDAYDASEIDRAKVRGFMRALALMALERICGMLLLAHVDKGTARGTAFGSDSYSGSTAWHNSARSRLFLSRDKDGTLILEHQKHNLGKMREPLRLIWPEGSIPQAEQPVNGFVQAIKTSTDTKALLRLIHDFYMRNIYINPGRNSPERAFLRLKNEATFPKATGGRKLDSKATQELLTDAENAMLITVETYPGADRHTKSRWALTTDGLSEIGRAGSAGSAVSTDTCRTHRGGDFPAGSAGSPPSGGVGGLPAHDFPHERVEI